MTHIKIKSTRKLCREILKVPKEELLALAVNREEFYVRFTKKKFYDHAHRHQQTDAYGAPLCRIIEAPFGYLKSVQRKIYKNILVAAVAQLPPEFMGGRRGYSNIDNARRHLGAEAVIKFDFRDFFPSIKQEHIYYVFHELLGFNPESAHLLAMLTTVDSPEYGRHLPQGACTSAALSMLTLSPLCQRLLRYLAGTTIKFSIWVDDITFSGPAAELRAHRRTLYAILSSTPYQLSQRKYSGVRCSGASFNGECAHKITGININRNGQMSLGHQHLRDLTHHIRSKTAPSERLRGQVLYVQQISRRSGRRLAGAYYDVFHLKPNLTTVHPPKKARRHRRRRTFRQRRS